MTINKKRFTDYFLLVLFIGSSGVPYLSTNYIYIIQFLFLFSIFVYRKKSLDSFFIIFIVGLLLITVLQSIKFDLLPIMTDIGLFTRVIAAYLIVKLLSNNFIDYYVRLMYVLATISLIIYIPIMIFPQIGTLLTQLTPLFHWLNPSSVHETIIIYNLTYIDYMRNVGPFWEAGAFGGYLILAFIFNFLKNTSIFDKRNLVLLTTIITTLSTTTYLALFTFLFLIFFKRVKNIFMKNFVILIIIISGYYAYTNFEFLGEKIESQLERASTADIRYDENTQRFLNILRDWHDFQGHEMIGRGVNPEMRYSFDPENQIRTVGLTDILVKFGIPFFLLMFFTLYKSISHYVQYTTLNRNLVYSIGIFSTVLVTLMSEVYFNYPFYWSLLFLHSVYKKPKDQNT